MVGGVRSARYLIHLALIRFILMMLQVGSTAVRICQSIGTERGNLNMDIDGAASSQDST